MSLQVYKGLPTINDLREKTALTRSLTLSLYAAGRERITSNFITDINQFDGLNSVYLKYFPTHKPARSCVVVDSLAKGAKVEIEAVAFKDKV